MTSSALGSWVRVRPQNGSRGFNAQVVRVGRGWVHVCGVQDGLTCGRAFVASRVRRIVDRLDGGDIDEANGIGRWMPCVVATYGACGRFALSEVTEMRAFGEVVAFPRNATGGALR